MYQCFCSAGLRPRICDPFVFLQGKHLPDILRSSVLCEVRVKVLQMSSHVTSRGETKLGVISDSLHEVRCSRSIESLKSLGRGHVSMQSLCLPRWVNASVHVSVWGISDSDGCQASETLCKCIVLYKQSRKSVYKGIGWNMIILCGLRCI